jgi:hypothetical protein
VEIEGEFFTFVAAVDSAPTNWDARSRVWLNAGAEWDTIFFMYVVGILNNA